jgi:hypothetical protein
MVQCGVLPQLLALVHTLVTVNYVFTLLAPDRNIMPNWVSMLIFEMLTQTDWMSVQGAWLQVATFELH